MENATRRVWDDRNPQMPGVEQSPRRPSTAGQCQVGVAWIASCFVLAGEEPAEMGCTARNRSEARSTRRPRLP